MNRFLIYTTFFSAAVSAYSQMRAIPATLTESHTLQTFRQPLTPEHTSERRVSSANGVIWFITPDGSVRRYVDGRAFGADVPLPEVLKTGRPGSLAIAPVDRDSAWVIDRDTETLWRVAQGKWIGPFHTGEPVGSSAARPDGFLILNTLAHSTHEFSVISPAGAIVTRFGDRLQAPAAALDRYANSWVVAVTPSGDVIVAHAFRPLLRRYDRTGKLVWEKPIALPSLRELDEARKEADATIRSNVQTCCIEAKLVRYASDVLVTGPEIAIRYGFNSTLEVFGDDGVWKRTTGINVPPNPLGWPLAGLGIVGDQLAACELTRLAIYGPDRAGQEIHGRVVDSNRKPVGGANVMIRTSNGSLINVTATAEGALSIRGLSRKTAGEVRVNAEGFLEYRRNGLLSQIFASPISLQNEPLQCVVVTDEDGKPITRFRLQVGRLASSAESVTRGGGRTREFSSKDGKGCVKTPVSPPLFARVWADGYATREVTISEPTTTEIRLSPEAKLVAQIHDDASQPVSDGRLFAQLASTEKRAALAIPGDMITTAGADGVAQLNGLSADEYRVVVEHPKFLRFEKRIRLEKGTNNVDVLLDRGCEITARVTSAAQRVAGAIVRAEGQGQRLTHSLECTTAADGTCSIAGAAPGRYFIHAEAAGRSRGQQTLVVAPDQRSTSVDIRLEDAVTLVGQVRGVDLYPETPLDLLVGKPGVPTLASPVSPTGDFRIDEAPSGQVNVWVAERGRNSTLLYKSLEIPNDPEYNLIIDLPRPIALSGRITLAGAGCGDCSLSLQLLGSEIGRPLRKAIVQSDGSFAVRLPDAGSYRATATDPLSGASVVRIEQIVEDRNEDFALGDSSLRVTVLEESGDPAASALVEVSTSAGRVASLTADDLGSARFSSLTAGHYVVIASLTGRAASHEIDVSGQSTMELRLPDNTPLHLRVLDAVSGFSLPMISARVTSARGETTTRSDLIANDGLFELPSFTTQPMTVVLSARGYALKTLRGVVGADVPVVVLMMPGGRSFTVHIADTIKPCGFEVRDASGNALALSLDSDPGPVPLFVRNAVFYSMEPGTYTAVLYDCTGRPFAHEMRLAPGLTPAVSFP